MPPLLHSKAQIAAVLVAALLLGAVGFLPLFGGPGYEASLIAGLLLPVIAGVATALEVALGDASPFDAVGRGALSGLSLAVLSLLIALVHGAWVGYCDPLGGVTLMALGGAFGAVMGGVWGGVVGLATGGARTRRRQVVLSVLAALAGPLGSVILSLWRFYSSPIVFAYDPFFGYFGGPLYDTIIEPIDTLVSYRAGSLATLIAVAVIAWHFERRSAGFLLVWRGRPGVAIAGALALAASIGITAAGGKLGHWSTTSSIRAELSRSITTERCEIVFAPSIVDRDAELLGKECDAHVAALERWFEAQYPERIVAFVFESPEQKGRLMGAATTYIAKPWRREVYIQFNRYPHPVLGHELAHVVAGAFGQGPFRVAGPLSGILPDPGRIEGVATAASPGENEELTLAEQARSMLELGSLPALERVFRLSFLGENAAKAYAASGAFVDWLRQTRGAAVVRGWYGGQSLEALTGRTLAELDTEWRAWLQKVEVPPEAMEAARARFERPAIFDRSCPHVVDGLIAEASTLLTQNDWRGASEAYETALELDPHNVWALSGFGSCAARAGRYDEARARYQKLASDPALPPLLQATGTEAIADLELALGRVAEADARYREIGKLVLDEDHLRTLDVKSSLGDPLARDAIVALLIGDLSLGRDMSVATAKLARWSSERPEDGTPDYLLGRNFYLQGRYQEAAARLDRALDRTLALPRVQREALRSRLVVACALGDRASALNSRAAWLALPKTRAAQRAAVLRFSERCGLPAP